jgi:hypothetical protein
MLLLILLSLPLHCLAWGSLGHRTVAYLASLYFTPEATRFTNHLLNGQDISEASLFADRIRYIPSFHYSAAWHYIDAQDDPPRQCGINITRDCLSEGCVVSAIANHTERVMNTNLPAWQRGQSLRFLIHFIGDVHQPLHTENEDRGGNEIPVLFDHRHTNLHSVWDTLIPNKYAAGENETEAAFLWAQKLYAKDVDPENSMKDECQDVGDAAGCALQWAGDANKWVCQYVLKDDIEGLKGDLSGEYYEGAVPVIDEMVAKGGRRLGAWLNRMVEETEGNLFVQDLFVQEL